MIKIKFHHLGHLADDLWKLGKPLSCFVLERKHRDYKKIVLYVFRSVEHTSTIDFVNFAISQFVSGKLRFEPFWLENPEHVMVGGISLQISWHLHSPIGEIHRDDVVIVLEDGCDPMVGVVKRFFQKNDDDIYAELASFEPVESGVWTEWRCASPKRVFVCVKCIKQNIAWCKRNPRVIRVLLPHGLVGLR